MAGLTLEQLKQMGAKPKTGGLTLEQLQPKEPNIISRIGEDITKRGENYLAGVEAQKRIEQTPLETGVQLLGQGAGLAFDIGGEVLKSVIDKIPKAIKRPIEEVAKSVLDTPLGQTGIKAISQGMDIYKEWKSGNPRAARDLEAVVNIAMLIPTGKIAGMAGKKAISTTGELAGKVATGLEKGLAEQTFKEALDIVSPKLTITKKAIALEKGKGLVTQKILPRKFEKITLAPTKQQEEMAKTVTGIVSKAKNPIDNIEAIRTEIGQVAQKVEEGLKTNDTIFNKTQLKSALNEAKEGSRVVFGTDKTLQNSYNAIVDEMMRQTEKTTGNLSGLLQARKNFDNLIEQKFPKLLSNPIGDTAKQNAVLDVRRTVNDFIESKLPEGNVFKEELRKQKLMYDAIKNISQKTASSVDASAVKKAMTALRQNPLVAGVTGGILTYGALMGMFSNPVVIGTLVLGGGIKLGKTIITSRILKESLISVLRFLEKAGKSVDASAIRGVINQLP